MNRNVLASLVVLGALTFSPSLATAQDSAAPRPMTTDDVLDMVSVSRPA